MLKLEEFIKNLKITRAKLEILALIIIFVCGMSVLLINHKSQGTLTYNQGAIKYNGQVVNHRMNGRGTLTFQNGDTYTGQFSNGVFDGKGTYKAANGWSYKGDFKKGQANGQGVLKAKNNKVYKGTFKQGIFQK